jgi:hypothetical protein
MLCRASRAIAKKSHGALDGNEERRDKQGQRNDV